MPRRDRLIAVLLVAVLAAGAAAVGAAGCGQGAPAAADALNGSWQRVVGGEPDPTLTLDITSHDEETALVFADHATGLSLRVPAAWSDGELSATLPAGEAIAAGVLPTSLQPDPDQTASASPTGSGPSPSSSAGTVAIVLNPEDIDGQLTVNIVLSDDTLQPIWIYQRVAGQ